MNTTTGFIGFLIGMILASIFFGKDKKTILRDVVFLTVGYSVGAIFIHFALKLFGW